MKKRSGGPQTAKGKAVTRLNAARHGIYSVTPVLPNVERQACAEPAEVPAGSPTASASSKTPVRRLRGEYTAVCIKNYRNCQTNLICQVEEASHYHGALLVPGRDRWNRWATPSACQVGEKARGNVRRDGHRPVRLPHAMGSRGTIATQSRRRLTLPFERLQYSPAAHGFQG